MMARAGAIEIGRFVDDDRRIARSGHDGPLRALQRRLGDGRSARDANQLHAAMLEHGFGCFQRRLGDDANEIVDPQIAINGLVETAYSFDGHPLAAGMRIDDKRVPPGDHAHGIARDRRQRVSHRGDGADHAERGVLDHSQAMIAAEHFAFQELDSGGPLAKRLEFFDFVLEPADPGLFHFHRAEFDRLLDRNPADVVDDSLAVGQAPLAQLLEGSRGGRDRFIDASEHAIPAGETR